MLVHGFPRKFTIKETAFSSALKEVTDQTSEMPDRMSKAWVNRQYCTSSSLSVLQKSSPKDNNS